MLDYGNGNGDGYGYGDGDGYGYGDGWRISEVAVVGVKGE